MHIDPSTPASTPSVHIAPSATGPRSADDRPSSRDFTTMRKAEPTSPSSLYYRLGRRTEMPSFPGLASRPATPSRAPVQLTDEERRALRNYQAYTKRIINPLLRKGGDGPLPAPPTGSEPAAV